MLPFRKPGKGVPLWPSGKLTATLRSLSGGVGAPAALGELALNKPFVQVGDSYQSRGYSNNTDFNQIAVGVGLTNATMEYLGHPWQMTFKGNKAHSGDTITQIYAQLSGALATMAVGDGLVIANGGVNDVSASTSAASILAQWDLLIADVVAAGKRLLINRMHPLQTAFGDARDTILATVNSGLTARATNRVKVFNSDSLGFVSGDFGDQLHFNSQGSEKYCAGLAAFLLTTGWVPAGTTTSLTTTSYLLNQPLAGGTTAPTSWTLDTSNAGAATVVGSKVGGKWRITISGNYTGDARYVSLNQRLDVAPNPATSDFVEALASYAIVGTMTNILCVDVNGQEFTAAFGSLVYEESANAWDQLPSTRPAGSYVTKTPMTKVNTGTAAKNYAEVRIYFPNAGAVSTACAATIDFDYITIRKAV